MTEADLRRALVIEYVTIAWVAVEAAAGLVSGTVAGSIALIGFGLDSVIELFAAAVVVGQLRGASDQRERRALRLIAVTFFLLAAYVLAEAARHLLVRAEPEQSLLGIAITAAALVVMPLLAWGKRRIGQRIGSATLLADATESAYCAFLAAAALIGLLLNATLGWWWADPLAGIIITSSP